MNSFVPASKGDQIRLVNRALVLEVIRKRGPISRADVKRVTGLNFTTVTNAVNDLMGIGLIQEIGLGNSRGGRKPLMLTLNPTGRYAVGCQMQSTELVVGIFDLSGAAVRVEREAKLPDATPDAVVERIAVMVDHLLAATGVPRERVEGVGVAAPGPLNAETGVLLTPPNLTGWRDVPLKRMLERRLRLPVLVEKDGNAAALGEIWFGAGRDVQNLIFIVVDSGIGAGVIINGALYRGSGFGAGEIGHTTVDVDGPLCSCGNHGCLEAIGSGFALARQAVRAIRRGVETRLAQLPEHGIFVPDLLEAAEQGDKLALDLLDGCGRSVGMAVANIVNLYNPELIILGGRLAQSPAVRQKAAELGRSRAFSVLADQVQILPSALGDRFLVTGAASLVLARLFRGPVEARSI